MTGVQTCALPIYLDIPPGQSLHHVPLALSGNKTVATLFQGAAKGSKVAILDSETGEWAEGELGDTWSNGAAELGKGSIFKFTNVDTKVFRALFVERRGKDADGKVVEYTQSYYRGDRYDYVVELG